MNHVRLYSNGTAVIHREYAFDDQETLRIAIPVRKTDLDDVVSSLAIFGDVTVVEPPSYRPTNADKPSLDLEPACALTDVVTKLAGTSVEIEAGLAYRGKLLGMHRYRLEEGGKLLEQNRIIVFTEKGVQQVDEASVTAIRFTDPAVQAEIERVLQARSGRIKPDSSQIELAVRKHPGATQALVTYATPVAAWKIRYQLRLSEKTAELEGQAVVDNDTDDDWTDTLITVVTGEPITFSTDLAEIRRPARSRVNIVAERATGAVVAAAVMAGPMSPDLLDDEAERGPRPMARMRATYGKRESLPPPAAAAPAPKAEQPQAEARESGDFSVFTSPEPVSVGARRSAIIPLFRTAVDETRVVLFYKEADDPQRPFRAIRFKNQAAHSLGRGICEVFVDGEFQGKSVLEPAKPGEEVLLIHAKETGVRVLKETSRSGSRRMAVKIAEGTVYFEERSRRLTEYRVQNSHDEAFPLEIEHLRSWFDSTLDVSASTGTPEEAKIPGGMRIRVELGAKQALTITAKEDRLESRTFALEAAWLTDNLTKFKAFAPREEEVRECIALQAEVGRIRAEIEAKEEAAKTLADEQERLIKLIPNGHAEQAGAWRTDLAATEKELRELRRSVIPKLKGQLQEATKALHEALNRLRYDWTEKARKGGD